MIKVRINIYDLHFYRLQSHTDLLRHIKLYFPVWLNFDEIFQSVLHDLREDRVDGLVGRDLLLLVELLLRDRLNVVPHVVELPPVLLLVRPAHVCGVLQVLVQQVPCRIWLGKAL